MRRRTQDPADYAAPGLDVDFVAFSEEDFGVFADAMVPTPVSEDRFIDALPSLNRSANAWKYRREEEITPARSKEFKEVKRLRNAAARLTALIDRTSTSTLLAYGVRLPGMVDDAPGSARYDLEHALRTQRDGGSLRSGFPDDPTAGEDGSLPWLFERLLLHFQRRYFGDPPEPRRLEYPNEALLEFLDLLRAFHGATGDRLSELSELSETEERLKERDDGILALPDGCRTANEALIHDLAPAYEDIVGRSLGRSRSSDSDPGGPALRFFRFVFDHLSVHDARAEETLLGMIGDLTKRRRSSG